MPLPGAKVDLPILGVGITYSSAIEPLILDQPALIDFLEVEPQTTWLETRYSNEPYRVSPGALDHILQLPGRKLVHSIGVPVGGTVRPEPFQLGLLQDVINTFGSPWASEHLSFNSTHEFRTGFFLPPRQTLEGVQVAVTSIKDLQSALSVPIAVETGVNYLKPRSDEMQDGDFVSAVVAEADCGLLLDFHNVFCNAVNGRQPLEEFLSQIPLDRVWEIHLAGGFELEGFWLDAHSGAIHDTLFQIVRAVVPEMPNLKAIVFEIYPSFVPIMGDAAIARELERIRELWHLSRTESIGRQPRSQDLPTKRAFANSDVTPLAWENALGGVVVGQPPKDAFAQSLSSDPGVRIVNRLAAEFRASMIVNVLRLTSRHLMLMLGPDTFRALLEDFWRRVTPRQYAGTEAEAFAEYIETLALPVPRLSAILEFELAVLRTLTDQQCRIVRFDFDPLPVFRALAEGRLPQVVPAIGDFEIEVTPDEPSGVIQLGTNSRKPVFPFH
jgi:uncharacterized protein (UPF0276 family)